MVAFNRTNFILFGFAFVFLSISFFPAISYNSAHCDDWHFWGPKYDHQDFTKFPLYEILHQFARPAAARITALFGMTIDKIADLRFMRLCSIGFLSATFVLFARRLLHSNLPMLDACLISLGVFLLPGPAVLASWAICAPLSLALLFAAIAAWFAEGFVQKPLFSFSDLSFRQSLIGAFIFFFLSLGIYQPAAMFFVTVAGVPYFLRVPNATLGRPLMRLLTFVFITCCLHFVCYKYVFSYVIKSDDPIIGRMFELKVLSLAAIPERLCFFFAELSYAAFNVWNIFSSPWIACGVGSIIMTGYGLGFLRKPIPQLLVWLLGIVSLVTFANIPMLAAAGAHFRGAPHRITFPYTAIVALLFMISMRNLFTSIAKTHGELIWAFFMAMSLCILGTFAHNNILNGFAANDWAEYGYLRDELKAKADQGFCEVQLIPPDTSLSAFGEPVRGIEFGYLASCWCLPFMIPYINEENSEKISWSMAKQDSQSSNVIDLRRLQTETKAPSFVRWPILALMIILGGFVFASRWLQEQILLSQKTTTNSLFSEKTRLRLNFEFIGLVLCFSLFFWLMAFGFNFATFGVSVLLSYVCLFAKCPSVLTSFFLFGKRLCAFVLSWGRKR